MAGKIDLGKFADDAIGVLLSSAEKLLGGASDDLTQTVNVIGPALAAAAVAGDAELTEELKVQLRILLEIHEIRVAKETMAVLDGLANVALGVASAALSTFVGDIELGELLK